MRLINYTLLKDELQGEYKQAFDKVEIYSGVRNIDSRTEDEMMMNLLDMLLTAQKEGKPAEKIVGKDIGIFCKEYFGGYGWKNRLQELPKLIYRLMWVIFVFCLIEVFVRMGEKDFQLTTDTTDVSAYFLGLFGSMVLITLLNCLVRPLVFRWKRFSSTMYSWLYIIAFLALIFGGTYLLGDRELNIRLFPMTILSGLYVLGYMTVRAVWRYQIYGSIRKPKEDFEQSLGEEIIEDVERELPLELVKRYEKKNGRREKRGKVPVTPEEYMEKLKKETNMVLKIGKTAILLIVAFCVGVGALEGICNGVLNGLILGSILLLCEIPVLLFIRFLNRGMEVRKRILEECRERGITILEYVK